MRETKCILQEVSKLREKRQVVLSMEMSKQLTERLGLVETLEQLIEAFPCFTTISYSSQTR